MGALHRQEQELGDAHRERAGLRVANALGGPAVVLVNGGRAELLPGTWSATLEWLVRRLAPRFPGVAFLEVRYRVRSWRVLDECVEDVRDGMRAAGDVPLALLGFSMGGAVVTRAAADDRVASVIGLAPWLPDALDVAPLAGRRLTVVHGSLDRSLPFLPGVSPALSRRGFDRALAVGATGEYHLVRGGLHALALRGRRGLVALPQAAAFARHVADAVEAFAPSAAVPADE
jgi:pimeloyl-ACP methyl ester carboxylesterase